MMLFTTTACRASRNNVALSPPCRIRSSSVAVKRSYMSTQTLLAPEEDPRMMLILGKPGGGKGTISNKILKVRVCVASTTTLQVWKCRSERFWAVVATANLLFQRRCRFVLTVKLIANVLLLI